MSSRAYASLEGCGIRAVFSAIRRSLASSAMSAVSLGCGARNTSRDVLMVAVAALLSVDLAGPISSVMTRVPVPEAKRSGSQTLRERNAKKQRGEPANRLPLLGTRLPAHVERQTCLPPIRLPPFSVLSIRRRDPFAWY